MEPSEAINVSGYRRAAITGCSRPRAIANLAGAAAISAA
jgi:hypothetical protein